MELLDIYILNLIITIGLLIATLYRAKIERDLTKVTIKNAELYHSLKLLKKMLQSENLTDKEFRELIEEMIRGCE